MWMSVFWYVGLQLKKRMHFHKILMWKIKKCLLFAPGANPDKEQGSERENCAPAEHVSICKHQHHEMRKMRESDAGALYQRQENESRRKGRREEGPVLILEPLINGVLESQTKSASFTATMEANWNIVELKSSCVPPSVCSQNQDFSFWPKMHPV